MSRSCPLLLLSVLLIPAAASGKPPPQTVPVRPQDPDDPVKKQVRELVREAGQFMDRGDQKGAVDKLLFARQLRPDPSLDYNLGVAYAEMGKRPEAAMALCRFLAAVAPDKVTADRVEDARRRLEAYREQLAHVRVQLAPRPESVPPPSLFVDHRPAPIAEEQWLEPGNHELRVSAPGARDYLVAITLQPREERTVSPRLDPLGPANAPGPAGPSAPGQTEVAAPLIPDLVVHPGPPPLYRRWRFWVGTIGGTAAAAVLIGVAAAAAAGRFNHMAPGSDLDPLDVGK